MGNFPLMPEQASTFAGPYDVLFLVTTILTVVFTGLVSALVVFFALRYRKGNKVNRKGAHDEHLPLELTWTILPLILGLVIFFWAAALFTHMRSAPKDAMEIYVIGKQWMWHIQHPDGVRENNELHVPLGKPVKLIMISQDVLHSFFIPQFRVKQDVIPGRYTTLWFEPSKVGRYNLLCAEYCGTQHSEMGGFVEVMEQAEYQKWLASKGARNFDQKLTMEKAGEAIYKQYNCAGCHEANDSIRGPSLAGLFGKVVALEKGDSVTADNSYVREAILSPNDRLTKGYIASMPTYKGQITEEQTLQLMAHIKTLGVAQPKPTMAPAVSPPAGSTDPSVPDVRPTGTPE